MSALTMPNPGRVGAVVRRYFYSTIASPVGLFETSFWPVVDLLLWGTLTTYLQRTEGDFPVPIGFLIGGLILWELVFRTKNTVAVTFLEETYWRNVVNMMASPLTSAEFLLGVVAWGLVRAVAGWILISLLAWALFSFQIIAIGPVVGLYVLVLLVFGVALALVVLGVLLRFGRGADELAWALAGVVLPFGAVFYSVETLPGWAQGVAAAMPVAHVFEGMRALLAGQTQAWGSLWAAAALDVVYLGAGLAFAGAMLRSFRRRGFVTRYM
ncbi:MAG: ABC transporter permease [Actinobacteria bacterium]|nr:ABC transporter permease [Actinomycetota bacterium]